MKKLAILGASYLQMPLVAKANQMGIETHCFAWDNNEAVCKGIADFFYPISVLDKEAIAEQCMAIGIDGIVTIATDICVPTISFVAEKMGLTANSYASAIASTNKGVMREKFAQYGINSPKFLRVEKYETGLFSDFNFPLIVKPTDRSGSRGVTKVYDHPHLEQAIVEATSESIENQAIIEEFIEGEEVSVEYISNNGDHFLLSITDKITTGEPYFVELEHHQPSQLPKAILSKIETETLKALQALEIQFGASHSEFKITKDGKIYAIEVGARMGGDFIGSHLTPLSTGYDFVEGVINVALNEFEVPVFKARHYSGVYFLCQESERLLPHFHKQNAFDYEKKILSENLESIRNSNDRSGFLIYQSDHKIII